MNEKQDNTPTTVPFGALVKRLLVGTSILSLIIKYSLYPETPINYCAIISLYSTFFGVPIARMFKI